MAKLYEFEGQRLTVAQVREQLRSLRVILSDQAVRNRLAAGMTTIAQVSKPPPRKTNMAWNSWGWK